ncbi:MAG: radical SAM protein [Bacteroidia bacterium]|nr:radical SAM protein [Bacteroidia bacterium]
MIVTEDKYLGLAADWHLRIDGKSGILYYYDPEGVIFHQLSLEKVVALLLMDGKNRLSNVREILSYLFDYLSESEIKKIIESLFTAACDDKNPTCFIKVSDTPTVSHCYDLEHFINKINNAVERDNFNLMKGRLAAPLNLTLMPSNVCVTDCIYCYAERKPIHQKELLSAERWLELIDEAHSLGVELAVFSGGDPLTSPAILPILKRAIEKGFLFILPTKTFVSKKLAGQMAEISMQKVWTQISLDAISPVTLKKMVGIDGYDQIASESISNLVEAGLKVRVNIVITPLNYFEVSDLARRLSEMGVKRIGFAGYGRSHYRHNDELFLTEDQIQFINEQTEILKNELKAIKINNSTGTRDFTRMSPEERSQTWKNRAKCSGGRSSIAIAPNGDVTLCEQMPLEQEYIVGNLKTQSIAEIWNSERMLQMVSLPMEKFKGTSCYQCNEFVECQEVYGHCFRDALFNFETIYSPPPACPKAPFGLRMQ